MRLSICIPTYNRAIELRQLLDSIVAQTGHRLTFEIVISDNASTDDTADLIAEYTAAGLPIVFERLPENRGFDRNILNVTAMASGEYCWLFGSDDVMEPGALAMLEDVLDRHSDLSALSIGSQGYNADLSQRVATIDNISSAFSKETMLHGREEPVATIGPWMGYMTSLIVRRSLWLRAIEYAPLEPYMRGYIHLYLAARMLDDQSTWLCVPKKLVGNRTHNESYAGKDSFARTRLDIEGFDLAFGDTLGRKNWAYRQAMSLVASFFIRVHFLVAKMRGSGWNYWRQAIPMTLAMYWRYPSFWLKAFPIALIPRSALLVREHIRTRRPAGRGGSTS